MFTDDTWETTWQRLKTDDGPMHVEIPELLDELAELATETPPGDDPQWPLLLSAGERRAFTANTILRDPAWRKKDPDGALRVSPADAERIGLANGGAATLTTKRATPSSPSPWTTRWRRPRRLPNGLGLDHVEAGARARRAPRPTSSPPARTATRGPARHGTRACQPDSSRSDRRHVAMTPTCATALRMIKAS